MDAVIGWLVDLPPWLVLAVVLVLPALEASTFLGLVVPGELAVLAGGVVAHGGSLPLWAVVLAAATGAAIGDGIGFRVGRRYGDRLLTRVPRRVRRSGELDRALDLVRRRGAVAVVVGRWAAVLRALVPGVAGASGMPGPRFAAANVLGGTLWAAVVAGAGYAAGASYRALERELGLGAEVFAAVIALLVLVWVVRSRRRASPAPPAPRSPGSPPR